MGRWIGPRCIHCVIYIHLWALSPLIIDFCAMLDNNRPPVSFIDRFTVSFIDIFPISLGDILPVSVEG